ncbi:hypothetical protein LTR10_023812 [Elasticomyces elasticus]|uniref:Uncharacterized protein n=1 Tax=Exophiala sideris TaxID=1016849 RepID=A0ABR0IXB8_9EURO|nr:hypothetical protein LTR10_023812 [Elasticomyces elasticus]KAK5022134.1 hypothetical protein LTS07_010384 [Exophiala sideris]KAK5025061.1 hypothetical protein LTR13_010621 [Exophiala sideris]KAK5051155.1 hypothetical protein LTR69_010367 [Exophiala sideris]KAK5176820.1 hypothetical protein LTR44_010641 [Eurotiomycetes sp. CCFEE 6388]
MWFYHLFLLAMAVFGLADMTPMSQCASTSAAQPGCTLTYTPYMAPQIAPTTTIYAAIMTTYYYIVDCRYCTVTNFENNPSPVGPFTAKTTSSMLTITRVECMAETAASTRGSYRVRGYEEVEPVQTQALEQTQWKEQTGSHKVRRETSAVAAAIMDLANQFSADILPDIQLLPGPVAQSLTEILSALFALNIADSGFNLTQACQQVQTTEIRYWLLDSNLNPDQVSALICWIARNGYDFNTTRAYIVSTLEAAVWGLEVAAGFSNNLTTICNDLDLFGAIGGDLGINTQQYRQIVCPNLSTGNATSSINPGPTAVIPSVTNGTTSWSNATIFPIPASGAPMATGNASYSGTGAPWGSSNGTAPDNSSSWGPPISYTGSLTSWPANWTQATDVSGTGVASDTMLGPYNVTGLRARTPPSPTMKPFYPAISTKTSQTTFKQY